MIFFQGLLGISFFYAFFFQSSLIVLHRESMSFLHLFRTVQFILTFCFHLPNLNGLPVQLFAFSLKFLKVFFCCALLLLELFCIDSCSIFKDTDLLKRSGSCIQSGIATASFILDSNQFLLDIFHILTTVINFFFQFFNLSVSAQKTAAVPKRTSCHGTSRIQRFPFQSYDSQTVTVFSLQGNCMINLINHQGSSKKLCHDIPIPFFCLHQRVRQSHYSRFLKGLFLMELLRMPDSSQGQKSHSSITILLQIRDQLFGSLFVLCYYILNTSSKGSLHSSLILFSGMD